MGTIEPAPRPSSGPGPSARWILLAGAIVVAFLVGRNWHQAPVPSPQQLPPAPESEAENDSASITENRHGKRRIGELELELQVAETERAELERQVEELELVLAQAQSSQRAYQQGLEEAVEELNRLEAELQELDARAAQRSTLDSLIPRVKPGPLGPPQVTITRLGFVTVSGLVRNPTDYLARGRLEVSLVGSAGVIETRAFPMRIAPASTERYDLTFPGIFPTERIAAQAVWVE